MLELLLIKKVGTILQISTVKNNKCGWKYECTINVKGAVISENIAHPEFVVISPV